MATSPQSDLVFKIITTMHDIRVETLAWHLKFRIVYGTNMRELMDSEYNPSAPRVQTVADRIAILSSVSIVTMDKDMHPDQIRIIPEGK